MHEHELDMLRRDLLAQIKCKKDRHFIFKIIEKVYNTDLPMAFQGSRVQDFDNELADVLIKYLEGKRESEKQIAKFDTLTKITEQLESCEAGVLKMNVAFIALKRLAEKECELC